MNDTFTISQGQGHEVEQALARNDWTNALLKKATKGDFFAKVRLVLEGKAEIIMKAVDEVTEVVIKKTTDFLKAVATVILGFTKDKKTKDCFKDSKRYYYRDGELDNWLSESQGEGIEGTFTAYQLEKEMTFREVAAAILGVDETSNIQFLAKALIENGHTVVLPQIEDSVNRTILGEDTGLLTNGFGNFFFVQDKNGGVSVVGVYRNDGGQWNVGVDRLDGGNRWYVGDRFFSRN